MVVNSINCGFSSLKGLPSQIWGPVHFEPHVDRPPVFTLVGAKMVGCMFAKFLGRTVTILVGGTITALFLNLAAQTTVGSLLGLTKLVAAVSLWPPSLAILAAIAAVVGAGLLTSFLIERYV